MPFSRSLSIEFLAQGFAEAGVEVPKEELGRAVDVLDGILGWLVDFGRAYLQRREMESTIESVLKRAGGFLRGELKELERRSPRYVLILEGIAKGYNRWELLRECLGVKGQNVPKARLAALLDGLEKMSWIVRESMGEQEEIPHSRPCYREGPKRARIRFLFIQFYLRSCPKSTPFLLCSFGQRSRAPSSSHCAT